MSEAVITRSFAAGELAPVLHARADQARYQSGLKRCRNFLVRREGGVSNRPGLRFVEPAKTNTAGTRLVRYVGSTAGESCLLEMGTGYLRVIQNDAWVEVSSVPAWSAATNYVVGDLVVRSSVNYYCILAHINHGPPNVTYWYPLTSAIYEIPTPFSISAGLPDWNQSGNVITFTHPELPPYELVFESLTRWVLRAIVTAPALQPPTAGLLGERNLAGSLTTAYKVTSAQEDSYEESNASAVITIYNHDTVTPAAPNLLWWTAVPGAAEYYIYADRWNNGTFGYIGTATGKANFRDVGVTPDLETTPPVARTPFATAGAYPAHSANYQQRRWFANTVDQPDAIWGSRIGFQSNFGIASPLQDDDSVTFRLAGNNHHPIRWMVALKAGLVLGTDGGEWTMTGGAGAGSPITPSSIAADQETYTGVAETVRPIVIGDSIIYAQARGSILRDVTFSQEVQGLAGADLTIWASHLFERKTLVAVDYQQVPHSIAWCVRDDGVLLGLTYVKEQDVVGWHRHDTYNGLIEDVCVVPEYDEEVVYVLVSRVIENVTKRYIERLERRDLRNNHFDEDAFFVDSGLSYTGSPYDTFGGLGHLEGQEVVALADGQVVDGTFTVTGGEVTLPANYSNVHIGLPITAEVETLNLDVQGSDARARTKRVPGVTLLVDRSGRRFQAGLDDAHLVPFEPESWEGVADEYTGPLSLSIDSDWGDHGRVLIKVTDPVPMTILGVMPNADLGGL